MNNELISVIVPVHNAADTLERCVHSIMNQTYRNLEIILVDDASTDSSRESMECLEQEDPERIMVICCDENAGPGGARNIGLMYAQGDYLGFVDSDDYIQSSFYEKLLNEITSGGYDYVDCGYFNEAKDLAMLNTGRDTRGKLTEQQKCELIVSGGYIWSKLFRRSLFADNGIAFREKCILEDSEVLVELIARSKSVGAVEETLYWYSATAGSASSRNTAASYVLNIYEAMKALIGLKDRLDDYDDLKPAIEYEILQMYGYGVVMTLKDAQTKKTLNTKAELHKLREIRLSTVTHGYDNPYVKAKIEKTDIEVMQSNDSDPVGLIRRFAG